MKIEFWDRQPKNPPKGWKKGLGYYGIAEDGTIFIPAGVVGNPSAVFLCASADGVPMVMNGPGKRVFVPAEWAAREYRAKVDADLLWVIEKIRAEHPIKPQDGAR